VTLRLGSGAELRPGSRLAAGGQGEVYAVDRPAGHVFKRYFPRELAKDPALEPRLRSMVAAPPAGRLESSGHVNMAWPVDVVYDGEQFAGFIMPVIDMASTVGIHRVTNPSDRGRARGEAGAWLAGFTWRYLVRTAVNLVQVTHALHAAGTVIGDFNDANVRVGRDARVTLLDCDSMQIRDAATGTMYLCRVGRPEFTAPELLSQDWSVTVRERSSDMFALAIHLYALLLEGEHPFRGIWDWEGEKPEVTELAARGLWASLDGGPLLPRPAAIGIGLLPPAIQQLFHTAFEHGAYSPAHRPGPDEWHRALCELEDELCTCAADPSHVYPAFHGRTCPWCEHARRVAPPLAPAPAGADPAQPAGAAAPSRSPLAGQASRSNPPPRPPALPAVTPGHALSHLVAGRLGVAGRPILIQPKRPPTGGEGGR
jgi:DNA-binding helix-hairpin-helix protein with protein kinase domain